MEDLHGVVVALCVFVVAAVLLASWPAEALCPRLNLRECRKKPVKPPPSPLLRMAGVI